MRLIFPAVFAFAAVTHCAAQPVSPPAPDTKSAYLAIVATAGERCFIARGLNFTANDAGKLIRVEHIGSFERWFVSRIASVSVVDGADNRICADHAPTQSVDFSAAPTRARALWGSDQTASLQKAFDDAANAGRKSIVRAGLYLVRSPLACRQPNDTSLGPQGPDRMFTNGFDYTPPLCEFEDGAVVVAAHPDLAARALLNLGSENSVVRGAGDEAAEISDFSGYLRKATFKGGVFDCSFVCRDAIFVRFQESSFFRDFTTKNTTRSGIVFGSQGTLGKPADRGGLPASGGATSINHGHARDASSVVVAGCTRAPAPVCTTRYDHGFATGRVVYLSGPGLAKGWTNWFEIEVVDRRAFMLRMTDGASLPAFTGPADAFLTSPSTKLERAITGVRAMSGRRVEITTATLHHMKAGGMILVNNVSGVAKGGTSCLDGAFRLLEATDRTFTVEADIAGCSRYAGNGLAMPWVDPNNEADTIEYLLNAADHVNINTQGSGAAFMLIANQASAGYDGKVIGGHFWSRAEDGRPLAALFVTGDYSISSFQVDCPVKFGFGWFLGPGNTITASSLNCSGFKDLFPRNAYFALRLEPQGFVNFIGGSIKGDDLSTADGPAYSLTRLDSSDVEYKANAHPRLCVFMVHQRLIGNGHARTC